MEEKKPDNTDLNNAIKGEFKNADKPPPDNVVPITKKAKTKEPPRYYTLPAGKKEQLRMLADPKCTRCRGSGHGKWKKGGREVEICKCVRERLPAIQKMAEEQKVRVEAEKAKVQAEQAIELKKKRRNEVAKILIVGGVLGALLLALLVLLTWKPILAGLRTFQ